MPSPFSSERGILYAATARGKFQLTRLDCAPELAPFVQTYWTVAWDLRGQEPFEQRLLTFASVNMTFKTGRSRIAGLTLSQFCEVLNGTGRIFGVRFRPGCFRPFLNAPVSTITDRFIGVDEVFGNRALALEHTLLSAADEPAMATIMDQFLCASLPARDPIAEAVSRMIETIAAEPGLVRVKDLAARLGVNPRRLQRLFAEYVGARPKWVIQQYRMHEALERSTSPEPVNWGQLAIDLGYSDQAHFSRDFTTKVGKPPTLYARDATPGQPC